MILPKRNLPSGVIAGLIVNLPLNRTGIGLADELSGTADMPGVAPHVAAMLDGKLIRSASVPRIV
jgi:hypothetical protein